MIRNSTSVKFKRDATGIDATDDGDYNLDDDCNDESLEILVRKFNDNITGLDDVDDYDEEFDGMRFHGISKNYKKIRDHCHYTWIYMVAANSICNLTYRRNSDSFLQWIKL